MRAASGSRPVTMLSASRPALIWSMVAVARATLKGLGYVVLTVVDAALSGIVQREFQVRSQRSTKPYRPSRRSGQASGQEPDRRGLHGCRSGARQGSGQGARPSRQADGRAKARCEPKAGGGDVDLCARPQIRCQPLDDPAGARWSRGLGGMHPDALGRRFSDVWRDIWKDISPLIDKALPDSSLRRRRLRRRRPRRSRPGGRRSPRQAPSPGGLPVHRRPKGVRRRQ